MFKALIELIREIARAERYKDLFRGLYVSEDIPKTYGTKIRRRNQ